jgi:D-alanyl-D-alanine carboxypeptidase
MEYIVVTMHAPSAPDAASDHIKLFDYAYANFTVQEVGLEKYRTSGGFISLPVGAKADDCTVEKTEDAGNGTVTYTYTYKGRYAGEMVITKENEKLYLAELKAEEEKAADESRKAAGISSPDGKDGSDSKAAAESEISASSSTESNSSPEPVEKKETPLMRKILIVLGVLVAVGFGMVLVSIHLTRERRRKYKLRRKRKRGKRG